MASVLAEFAEYYNYKHNRNGHVFKIDLKVNVLKQHSISGIA